MICFNNCNLFNYKLYCSIVENKNNTEKPNKTKRREKKEERERKHEERKNSSKEEQRNRFTKTDYQTIPRIYKSQIRLHIYL